MNRITSCSECGCISGQHSEWCSVGRNWTPSRAWLKFWFVTGSCFIAGAAFMLFASCSPTITRPEVQQRQASHTSTGQDSGVLTEKSTGPTVGVPVNQEWIDGYDSLLEKYGNTLSPPRKKGDRAGITKEGDHYRISDAVWERQLVMNQRRVNEQGP